MSTGENDQALRKILDMTRLMAMAVLFLHFYYYYYAFFRLYEVRMDFTDRILGNIRLTGLYASFHNTKLIALAMLAISLIGRKARKMKKAL